MLGLRRRSPLDKVKTAVRDAVSYADEIASDERLRADLRAAMSHAAEARDRLKKDVADGSIAARLADDGKLRKNVSAMLDDLDSASDRVRHRNRHRLRNALLVLGSLGAVTAALPNVRRWMAARMSARSDSAVDVGMTV